MMIEADRKEEMEVIDPRSKAKWKVRNIRDSERVRTNVNPLWDKTRSF